LITEEQLEQIEAFGGLFSFSKTEIIAIVGIMPEHTNEPIIEEKIKIGELKSKAKLHQSIFNLAYNGSSDAHKQVIKIIQESKQKRY
jgi:hypothetical protein